MSESFPTKMDRAQVEAAGRVLTDAFFNDAFSTYLLPDANRRRTPLRWFMERSALYGQIYGEPYVSGRDVRGVAIWMGPESRRNLGLWPSVRSGLICRPFRLGLPAERRIRRQMTCFDEVHDRFSPAPDWHLWFLAVDPPFQGQGIGSSLLMAVLPKADLQGTVCWLETENERNLPLYRRHGFEVVHEGDLPDGGLHFWSLKRNPRG